MLVNKHLVKYQNFNNTIRFPNKINSYLICDFASAINQWQRMRPDDLLTLDFMSVQHPYSNGMLPIIATIEQQRQLKKRFRVLLPNDNNVRKIFIRSNWAHLLDPINHNSATKSEKHLMTQRFSSNSDLAWITQGFMDVVLSSMKIPKDIFSALEWSIYEICDNVLNHSESNIGGFAQVITFSKQDMIAFTVVDTGRGILNSLREGIPSLKSDAQAIGEAIKAGVTRNKEHGQGNGLAGSLRITTMTQGSIDITSGCSRFYTTNDDSHIITGDPRQSFNGTSVSGIIRMNSKFSISKALDFGGPLPYTPVDTIDLNYEMKDADCFLIKMKEETTGVGTRFSGKQLRMKTRNLIDSNPTYPIYVDWAGIPVIASSFADEYMGKLFIELGPLNFSGVIRNKNMESVVKQLLDKAISQRLQQNNNSTNVF